MFSYANEAMFSRSLVAMLRKKGYFVQRIESHETGKGIPDIYCIAPNGVAIWLELKRVHRTAPFKDKIQWRPGQQAWLHTVTRRKQRAYTLVCYNDAIVRIAHTKIYTDNLVIIDDCPHYSTLSSL